MQNPGFPIPRVDLRHVRLGPSIAYDTLTGDQNRGSLFFAFHDAIYIYMIQYSTSSTAQGGGGSFKNRKPMGEVGCCESRMAERIH